MIPDFYEKTVKLNVKYENGNVIQLDGNVLPKIKNGTICDLIIPAYSFENKDELKGYTKIIEIDFLPTETEIFVGVSVNMTDPEKIGKLKRLNIISTSTVYGFVIVIIEEPLKLLKQGYKTPSLKDCKCKIALLNKNAKSLNNAATIISKEFETKRLSNSCNVFSRCFIMKDENFIKLEDLRDTIISEYDSELNNITNIVNDQFRQLPRRPEELTEEEFESVWNEVVDEIEEKNK